VQQSLEPKLRTCSVNERTDVKLRLQQVAYRLYTYKCKMHY